MILYDNAWSGNCYKVRLLAHQLGYRLVRRGDDGELHDAPGRAEMNASAIGKEGLLCSHLGLPLERRELSVVDRSNRPEILGGLNPALRVPTLIFDDGRVLPESNAIIYYLAEDTPYLPTDRFERAQVLQWMFFEQYDLEPNIAVARFWKLAGLTPDHAALEAKLDGGYKTLDALDRYLRDRSFLVADRYTIADICVYAYTHVADQGGFDLSDRPAVRAWTERVAAQPGHIKITD